MTLRLIFALFWILKIGFSQEILSIGQYNNSDFKWVRKIPNLQFTTQVDCSGLSLCQIDWYLNGVRLGFGRDTSLCFNLTSYVEIECSLNGIILVSDITIFGQFDTSGQIPVKTRYGSSGGAEIVKPIEIADCNSTSEGIAAHVNVEELNPSSYNDEVNVSCVESYTGTVLMTCLFDATWSHDGDCTEVTTTTQPTTSTNESPTGGNRNNGGLSCAYAAAIAMISIQVLFVVGVVVLVCVLQYAPVIPPIIGLYITGNCLGFIGILMSFLGSTGTEQCLNEVETAGVVIGSIALAIILAGLIWHAIAGPTFKKDYEPGSAN